MAEIDFDKYEQAVDTVMERVKALLFERHKKYGKANISLTGEKGVVVRLGDKWARLKHAILDNGDKNMDFDDETILDTWYDVIGYGVIGTMLRLGLYFNEEG